MNKRGQTRGVAIALVILAMILIAYVFIATAYPSITNFSISEKKCSDIQVPYTVTEPTTTRQCSDITLLYSEHASFDKTRIKDKHSERDYSVYFTIKNEDTTGGEFQYRNFYSDYSCEDESWYNRWDDHDNHNDYRWYHSSSRDCQDTIEEYKTVYLEAGEEKSFSYDVPLSRYADRQEYDPEIIAPTKQVCKTVTQEQQVIKYRTQEVCN